MQPQTEHHAPQNRKEHSMANMGHLLGIYEDTHQLDHDTEALLENLLADLAARGVARSYALAAVRRTVRSTR